MSTILYQIPQNNNNKNFRVHFAHLILRSDLDLSTIMFPKLKSMCMKLGVGFSSSVMTLLSISKNVILSRTYRDAPHNILATMAYHNTQISTKTGQLVKSDI